MSKTIVTLQSVCDDLNDGLHKAPIFNPEGEYLFVNATNLQNGEIVDKGEGKRADYAEFCKYGIDLNENTILYSIDGTIGNMAWYRNEKVILGKGACYLKVKSSVFAPYIYYLLQSDYFTGYVKSMKTGSTIHHISLQTMREFTFTLPSYDEQVAIGTTLQILDEKIRNNSKICAELESMAKTIYDYWFTQFDFPNAEGKPYRSSGGKMVWNEQLKREIPEGWDVVTVDSVLDRIPNTTRIQTSDYLRNGKLPVIDQSTDFIAGFTNDETALLQSVDGFIVFGDHTRIVKYIRFPFARGADGTQVLKSNTARMPDELLYQVITRIDLSNYGYARHFKFLKDSLLMLPDEIIAQRFKELVVPMYEQQVKCYFENIELSRLRDWLLPMLMNGQATIE